MIDQNQWVEEIIGVIRTAGEDKNKLGEVVEAIQDSTLWSIVDKISEVERFLLGAPMDYESRQHALKDFLKEEINKQEE